MLYPNFCKCQSVYRSHSTCLKSKAGALGTQPITNNHMMRVKVGNDQEMAQSERNSHSKHRGKTN